LAGVNEESTVRAVTEEHKKVRLMQIACSLNNNNKSFQLVESVTVRYMLKFLRERGMSASYAALLAESGVELEDQLLKDLHQTIITGDFPAAESLFRSAADTDLFATYLQSCRPNLIWARMDGKDPPGGVPTARGGHAMCIDEEGGIIYLHGGFDGEKSLDDLWAYSIADNQWRMLHDHTSSYNGPGPRSCHQMIFDNATGDIYLLGRLSDDDAAEYTRISGDSDPDPAPRPSTSEIADEGRAHEFWRYHARGRDVCSWERVPVSNPNMVRTFQFPFSRSLG
jgi:muskelin